MTETQLQNLHELIKAENFAEFFEKALQLSENQEVLYDKILIESALWHDAQNCLKQKIPLYLENQDQIPKRTKQRLTLISELKMEENPKNMDETEKKEENKIPQVVLFGFGVILLFVGIFLVNEWKCPDETQYKTIRIVFALMGGFLGGFMAGFISIKYRNMLNAGGGLAVFVVLYVLNPAENLDYKNCGEVPEYEFFVKINQKAQQGVNVSCLELEDNEFTNQYGKAKLQANANVDSVTWFSVELIFEEKDTSFRIQKSKMINLEWNYFVPSIPDPDVVEKPIQKTDNQNNTKQEFEILLFKTDEEVCKNELLEIENQNFKTDSEGKVQIPASLLKLDAEIKIKNRTIYYAGINKINLSF